MNKDYVIGFLMGLVFSGTLGAAATVSPAFVLVSFLTFIAAIVMYTEL